MKKLIITILFLFSLAGCSQHQVPNDTRYIQESTLQECTGDTPIPQGTTGADVLQTLNDWQTIYNQCRAGKHALIQAVRNDNNTKNN